MVRDALAAEVVVLGLDPAGDRVGLYGNPPNGGVGVGVGVGVPFCSASGR